jgi:eukaryotic-like serine/threonine-protein kinase
MSLVSGTKLGPYEVISPLGAGGMGEVYRARDPKLNRDVAIKVLPAHLSGDPTALARFEREAATLAATSHPNILTIFDFQSSGSVAYAVTELLEGDTLRGALAEGPLPARKAIEYAIQIADGLGAAHERGIVHRDLKPENIFVTRDGRVKILDFGLARQQPLLSTDDLTSPAYPGHTEPGTVLGTIGYMSPEQVRGTPADARSDIFSFGVVLYEMLAGQRAFKGDSAAETLHAILKDEPADLTELKRTIPLPVDRIVKHCLEKSPEQRFQSARDLAFGLRSLSTTSETGRSAVILPAPRERIRHAAVPVALLGIGIALGVAGSAAFRKAPSVALPVYHRLTVDRGEIGRARFAPDGETVVYNAAWRGEPTQIFTTRLNSRESRPLGFDSATLHAVSSGGELALGRRARDPGISPATLSRVPLAGGAPRDLLEGVLWADWSPGGADLAVVRIDGNRQRVEFPIGKPIYETVGSITHMRVSPLGDWVAFAGHPPDSPFAKGDLIVVDRTGAKKTLSKDWADLFGIAWRPDGREVWFTAAKADEIKALRAVTVDGEERLVTRALGQVDLQDISRDGRVLVTQPDFRQELLALPPGATSERDLTWLGLSVLADMSADGTRVLFSELALGGGAGEFVYLRTTDGSPAVRLGEGSALSLSPDGKWALALQSSSSRLVALPTGAGEPRDLTRPGMSYVVGSRGFAGLSLGTWFSDSRRVMFVGQEKGGPVRAFVQDIDGGNPRAIGPPSILGLSVSPDGSTLVAWSPDGPCALYQVDGGTATACRGFGIGDRPVRWSADGRSLLGRHDKGSSVEVFAQDLATGRRKVLWNLTPADRGGVSSIGAIAVSPDGRSYAYSFFRNVSALYLVDGLK